jgi:penicillin-binding protein 2
MLDRDASSFTPRDDRRIFVLSSLATAAFLALALRLFFLQVVRGPEFSRRAERNSTQILPLQAPRGLIYGREGGRDVVLMDNAPRFSLFYAQTDPEGAAAVESELRRWLPEEAKTLSRKFAEARRSGKMTRLSANIPREAALALMERRIFLPGVNVLVEPRRRGRYGALAAHLLGAVEEASEEDLRREGTLRSGQMLGKTGVEKFHDAFLRGADGGIQLEMNAAGRHVQVLQRIPYTPGADLYLTLDRGLQAAAEAGLAASPTGRGAAVAVDPRTGEVLALASAPGFDPAETLAPHLLDARLPLFNRALQGAYPPGSIFKIVTAAAGLQGGWKTRTRYTCAGSLDYGGRSFGCWKKHGRLDFFGAVAWSCNIYFYNVGQAAGAEALEKWAREFGFGARSGIDLPSESAGLMPGPAWKKKAQRQAWVGGDTLNTAIGQGAVVVTPLQAAVFLAAVANRGTVWRPFLVSRAQGPQGRVLFQQGPQARGRVGLSPETWDTLHRALEGVVTGGSGRGVARPDLVIGAKTGTAQNPQGEDHAWFGAYAGKPGEPSSLALVVFVENGGQGSAAAGPVARAMLDAHFPREVPSSARKPEISLPSRGGRSPAAVPSQADSLEREGTAP